MTDRPTVIVLSRASIGRALSVLVIVLMAASVAGQISKYVFGHGGLLGFVPLFDLDREHNVPSYVATALILCAAALFLVVARLARQDGSRDASKWVALSLVFVYMGFDEAFQVHERLTDPVRVLFDYDLPAALHFAWVVPALGALLALGLYFLPFLRRLSQQTRLELIVAGALYVTGALGVEMAGGAYYSANRGPDLIYKLITTLEEGLELAGLSYAIYALLGHLQRGYGEIRFQLRGSHGDEADTGRRSFGGRRDDGTALVSNVSALPARAPEAEVPEASPGPGRKAV